MVVVETSVWIDLFRGAENKNSSLLKTAIDELEDTGICGIIFTEVLQGIRHEGEYKKVRTILDGISIYHRKNQHMNVPPKCTGN